MLQYAVSLRPMLTLQLHIRLFGIPRHVLLIFEHAKWCSRKHVLR